MENEKTTETIWITVNDWNITLDRDTIINVMVKWLDKSMEDMFKYSYSNPLTKIIEEEMKKEEGTFKTMLRNVIIDIINSIELKDKVRDFMAEKIIKDWLKNN